MKRYGEYGFTFDSKAEEWAHWARSCLDVNPPRDPKDKLRLVVMFSEYFQDTVKLGQVGACAPRDHMGDFARPSQAQNNTGIGVGPRNRVLWPLLAGSALIVAVAVGMVM